MRHWKLLTALLVPLLAAGSGCGRSENVPPAYSVGGTVSGLAGTGLTLRLNEGDPLQVSGNAFTFPTQLATGTAYTVSVGTQPASPAQQCTPTNESGTVGTSDITNVQVTCAILPPGTSLVSGSVANLEGSGLRLTVNRADELALAAGATSFTFPTPLSDGSQYEVAVSAQPPGATCSVTGGAGTVNSGNPTGVAVECLPNAMVLRVGPIQKAPPPPDPPPAVPPPVPVLSTTIDLLEFAAAAPDALRTIPIPRTHSITFANSYEGGLTRSSSGRLVSLAAYEAAPGTEDVASTKVGARRSAITVDAAGTVTVAVNIPEQAAFTASTVRCAVTEDGSGFWMSGGGGIPDGGILSNGGIWYGTAGSTPVRITSATNTPRWLGIFGGHLFMSAAPQSDAVPPPPPSPYVGVSSVGTGLPTLPNQPVTRIEVTSAANEAEGFAFVSTDQDPAMDVLYVASFDLPAAANTINVHKYVLKNNQWERVAAFVPKFTDQSLTSEKAHGVAAKRLADGTTLVYVTTLNKLVTFRDDGTDSPPLKVVTSLPTNLRFRGVALAPVTR